MTPKSLCPLPRWASSKSPELSEATQMGFLGRRLLALALDLLGLSGMSRGPRRPLLLPCGQMHTMPSPQHTHPAWGQPAMNTPSCPVLEPGSRAVASCWAALGYTWRDRTPLRPPALALGWRGWHRGGLGPPGLTLC